jgi:hypothetical protein
MVVRNFFSTGSRARRVGSIALSAVFAFALLLFAASRELAAGQLTPITTPQTLSPGDPLDHAHVPDDQPYVPRELQARQLKRLREEHQKQVFSEAARLVQLATALKLQVQKGDKVSVDAIKDVDEIGKLAKRLSEHIKTQ